jgi:type II secretory pathway pseudopilin PulG
MYSFIEILLVFAITGILATLAFFAFRSTQEAVSDDLSINALESVALAQREFYSQRGVWLTDPSLLNSFIPNTSFATPAVSEYDVSLVEQASGADSSLGIAILSADGNCLTTRLYSSGPDSSGSFVPSDTQPCSGAYA